MCEAKNFYLWLLQIIGLLGLLALCLWLSFRPKEPTFTITEFSVPSISSQKSSAPGDAYQDDTVSITLEIKNPNKDSSIYYNDTFFVLYFGQDTVGKRKISSFKQEKDKKIQDRYNMDADEKVQRALANSISNGNAELKADLSTMIRYNTWGIRSKHHAIHLQATIPVGSDGKISGKKKKIKLHNLYKKWKLRDKRFL
ncbi:hypothetical protein P3X46_033388 [Hevea brasiliensis]|uniref:Late embryogenesis abundant protein LEA-2 subgroup domain-containing protein n=1 Tax=Hevea brasiliensis TaxID=3981 RepID=A0ABQ9KI55_HEVBR|nr:hypothetical protein P3X46_033388 [Hevea brasiliensis]